MQFIMCLKIRDKLRFFSVMPLCQTRENVTAISCKTNKKNTFHILVIVSQCSGSRICGNFSGRLWSTFFFSFPTMLVQSYKPLGVPSALRFSHTLKLTPQLLIASMVFCMFFVFSGRWCLVKVVFLVFLNCIIENVFLQSICKKTEKTPLCFQPLKYFQKIEAKSSASLECGKDLLLSPDCYS